MREQSTRIFACLLCPVRYTGPARHSGHSSLAQLDSSHQRGFSRSVEAVFKWQEVGRLYVNHNFTETALFNRPIISIENLQWNHWSIFFYQYCCRLFLMETFSNVFLQKDIIGVCKLNI